MKIKGKKRLKRRPLLKTRLDGAAFTPKYWAEMAKREEEE